MKVAIVHPWFVESGGAEKVVDAFAEMYPAADILALAADAKMLSPTLRGRNIRTSFLNNLVNGSFRYKRTLFMAMFPSAVESLDLRGYDLVISSCGPVMMGVNPSQDAIHISYIHSPQRAWWDLYADRQAKMASLKKMVFLATAPRIRMFEFSAMQRVDRVVSNSNYIARRVSQYFRRDSTVIYPPVETSRGYIAASHDNYYLTVSRLEMDKRIDILIKACNILGCRLVIAGTGREEKQLKSIAGPTVEFAGRVPDEDLAALYAKCRAFLFAADEDFGIAPVEAQSYGRPVIAFGHGGSCETVRVNMPCKSDTGIFFESQTEEAVARAINAFEMKEHSFNPEGIQEHARTFDKSVFHERFANLVRVSTNDSGSAQRHFALAAPS